MVRMSFAKVCSIALLRTKLLGVLLTYPLSPQLPEDNEMVRQVSLQVRIARLNRINLRFQNRGR